MRILAIDVGTGTQDILLFDSENHIENNVKLVLPSATEIAARRIRAVQAAARPLLLEGAVAGGGPCSWALEAFLHAGGKAYATAEAAQTIDDDLDRVRELGVTLVSDDEALRVDAERVRLGDVDLLLVEARADVDRAARRRREHRLLDRGELGVRALLPVVVDVEGVGVVPAAAAAIPGRRRRVGDGDGGREAEEPATFE